MGVCACGCAGMAKDNRKYIWGHNRTGAKIIGRKLSQRTRHKIGKALKGRTHTKTHRDNLVRAVTGHEPYYSPFVPGLRVHYAQKEKRWRCIVSGESHRTTTHARVVYEYFHGPIPDGWRIHHKNGDPTKLEHDHPDNLIAVPEVWNLWYFPALAKGFGIPESHVTDVYLGLVDTVAGENIFAEVVRILLQQGSLRAV